MEKLEVPEKLELTETQKTSENTNSKSTRPGRPDRPWNFDGIERVDTILDRLNIVFSRWEWYEALNA